MKLGEGKREFGRQKAEDRMKRVAFGASRSCPQGTLFPSTFCLLPSAFCLLSSVFYSRFPSL